MDIKRHCDVLMSTGRMGAGRVAGARVPVYSNRTAEAGAGDRIAVHQASRTIRPDDRRRWAEDRKRPARAEARCEKLRRRRISCVAIRNVSGGLRDYTLPFPQVTVSPIIYIMSSNADQARPRREWNARRATHAVSGTPDSGASRDAPTSGAVSPSARSAHES